MKRFIIDGLNLVFRAHNANFELKTASGMPSGMFYGFFRTLLSLKKKYSQYSFMLSWDNRAHHKYALQADYKAGRTPLSSLVATQIDDIKKCLENVGIDQYEKVGQEADDVIASLVERFKSDGHVLVYSNDKDMLQLVEDGKVTVFKPKVGNSPECFYDEEKVKEAFGVPPQLLACFRSFDGDSSDNIKGVPRVPRKMLASLVSSYKDIETVYNNLSKISLTDFQERSLKESKNVVLNNYRIIKLDRAIDDIVCHRSKIDKKFLEDMLSKYEIKSINPDDMINIFSYVAMEKHSDSYVLKTYSLFD